jgi:hypothetical protein
VIITLETEMLNLDELATFTEDNVFMWAAEAARINVDKFMDDQDRQNLHELLMTFGRLCQSIPGD